MPALRIAVVGTGFIGLEHVARFQKNIVGATVSAIVEPDETRARSALLVAPDAKWFPTIESALDSQAMDAVVVATPGHFHEQVLLPVIAAGLPILCEKPLTPDPESALRIVEAEVAGGKKLIRVGFMRRFDAGYKDLRELISSKRQGELLGLHCAHRNPSVPDSYHNDMLIFDSVVHEIDIVRFLTDSPIKTVQVRHFKRNTLGPELLKEPILVLLETDSGVLATVEMNVSAQFGYQVTTEAMFEKGIAEIGRTSGMTQFHSGEISTKEHASFKTRFADAFNSELQSWVNSIREAAFEGPSAWDGYLAAAAVFAGLNALHTGAIVPVTYSEKPSFYK